VLDQFITLPEIIPPPETNKQRVLRDHIDFMRNHPDTKDFNVDPAISWPEVGYFYMYCRTAGFDDIQVYPIMLLNNMVDTFDFNPRTVTTLRVPTAPVVQGIIATLNNNV